MNHIYIQYMYSYPHKTAYRPLAGVNLKDYGGRLKGKGHGLYVHIPFCETKCGYCNLFSVTGQRREAVDGYLLGVKRQLLQYGEILKAVGAEFSDLTIGGGTPLLLEERQLEQVFSMIWDHVAFEKHKTIVIETAPNQTTRGKLSILKEMGVTRVSMGIQSFCQEELAALRRNHGADQARRALELLKSFDFPCVNLDFIYGIPGQTVGSLLKSLEEAVRFDPEEVFLYPLYVKHGAGLVKDVREGMVLDPEKAFEEYEEAGAYLKSQGYRQDSMRRFVRKQGDGTGDQTEGREFSDCGFGTSLALGCGGRSYLGNLHFCTPYAITAGECLKELKAFEETEDFTWIRHGMILSREEEKRRYVIRHLLIRPGLPLGRYKRAFGTEVQKDFPILKQWIDQGLAVLRENDMGTGESEPCIVLTEKGLGLSDYLGPQLISPEVGRRMKEWDDVHG